MRLYGKRANNHSQRLPAYFIFSINLRKYQEMQWIPAGVASQSCCFPQPLQALQARYRSWTMSPMPRADLRALPVAKYGRSVRETCHVPPPILRPHPRQPHPRSALAMRFCRHHAELALLVVSSHPHRDCRGPTDSQDWPDAASALPGPLPPALPSVPLPRWHVRCAPVLCPASYRQSVRMCQLHPCNPPSPFQTQPPLHQPCPRSQPQTRAQIWNQACI